MDVRKDFPILKKKINGKPLVYLDNAATTQKPIQVIDAVANYYREHNGNVGRGVHTLAREAAEAYEESREVVADFINAKTNEIIFTGGATESMNIVARGHLANLGKGDEVVTSVMEHHSNYVPIRMLAEKTGCSVKLIDIDGDGKLDLEKYAEVIKDSKLVSIGHVSNVLGTINPVKEMINIAHENDALFTLDGAQSVPHMHMDVKKLDCDFLVFSGHKMLAPMGIGVLYGKRELLDVMEPSLVGGGMVADACGDLEFLQAPYRFEAGTPNVGGAVGLSAAIDYLQGIGMKNVQKHCRSLANRALAGMKGLEVYGPKERESVISFNVPGVDSSDVATIMDDNGIAIRSGQHCAQPLMCRLNIEGAARMSFYIYNSKEEVTRVLDVIDKVRSLA
jgi:cysteine desulfurase/selenocysteine lyase